MFGGIQAMGKCSVVVVETTEIYGVWFMHGPFTQRELFDLGIWAKERPCFYKQIVILYIPSRGLQSRDLLSQNGTGHGEQ